MEPSPLTQDAQPTVFQPKVVQLYEQLLSEQGDEYIDDEGFWQELFLHKVDARGLRDVLDNVRTSEVLALQSHTQELFRRAIGQVKMAEGPSDEVALDTSQHSPPSQPDRLTNQTLTVFLGVVLRKRFTNPSSDIISILAGLNDADKVFMDFVGVLDSVIRGGRNAEVRQKAVRMTIVMVSGAWGTGLISYFTHRDLFPAIMKCAMDADDSTQVVLPFYLLGLLANYNKFEFQNPYRLRLDDFVNEQAIKKVVTCVGATCASIRDRYVATQDDLPEGWNFGSTLQMIGLGVLAPGSRPATPTPNADEAKNLFGTLPDPEAGILLATYDFVQANKVFCFNLVTLPAEAKTVPTPLSSFLSLTSYLFQHAHRSTRSTSYTYLCLFILQILLEDQTLLKRICSDESKTSVRLCRQRQPYLPQVKSDRVMAAVILDTVMDGMNHNLRRRLDIQFYLLCLGVLTRIISFLVRTRTRLPYHWSELWRSLLSFIRFLTIYADDIRFLSSYSSLVTSLTNTIALALTHGETFLPDPASYDDLFYKLVELGDVLVKFQQAYSLEKNESMETLVSVSRHYAQLVEERGGGKKNLGTRDVQGIIRQGYETLSIQAKEGLDQVERFREGEWRNVLKRCGRVVVEDARALGLGEDVQVEGR